MRGRDTRRFARGASAAMPLAAAALAITTAIGSAAAQGPGDSASGIGGEIRPARPPYDDARHLLDAILFVPRAIVEGAFLASTATAAFLEEQQVVPRTRALLRSEDGRLRVTPTVALAWGAPPELGVRLSTVQGAFASMTRIGVVDQDTYLGESRVLLSLGATMQTQLHVEAFEQRRDGLVFVGVGPVPREDPRNAFLPGQEGRSAAFAETRGRVIAGVSSRVGLDTELLLSSSFQQRLVTDPRASTATIATTFAPGSVHGAYAHSERVYVEGALRGDTRAPRGPPSAGLLVEVYGGASEDVAGAFARALHTGGVASMFLPVVRSTTIVNPRVSIEVVEPLGDRDLPFRELSQASGFRGVDGRVDRVAALASVDYRWQLIPYVAARLFVDATTVAPGVTALRVTHLAWALGGGLDLHSRTTELGRLGVSYSTDAVRLILVFGLAGPGFGDRQHR